MAVARDVAQSMGGTETMKYGGSAFHNDPPPSWAMEAGKLLPEPTKEAEAAWFADMA